MHVPDTVRNGFHHACHGAAAYKETLAMKRPVLHKVLQEVSHDFLDGVLDGVLDGALDGVLGGALDP